MATGVETSVNELVRRILAVMDRPDHPTFHSEERPGDVRRHLADVSKLTSILGHETPTLTDRSLQRTVDWYRAVMQ